MRGLASGGAAGSRTPDLFDANEARYQLRYSPECPPRIPGRWIRDGSVVDRPAMLEDAVELAHLARGLRLDARCGLIDLGLLDGPFLDRRLLERRRLRLRRRRVRPALWRLRLHRVRRPGHRDRLPAVVGSRRGGLLGSG